MDSVGDFRDEGEDAANIPLVHSLREFVDIRVLNRPERERRVGDYVEDGNSVGTVPEGGVADIG